MSDVIKPNLVVILSRFPFPLEKGDKLRAYYQIIDLSEHYNITLLAISENEVPKSSLVELEKYCKDIHIFVIPKWKSLMGALFSVFGSKPIQVGYFYDYSVQKKITSHLNQLQPDHIYCQLIRASEYVKNYHDCPKTLDYMDAFSKGIERRIDQQPFYKKWLFRLESKRLANYEREIFDYFEVHSIISEQDAHFLGTTPNQKVLCVPNGVANSFIDHQNTQKNEFDLVFVGNLNYPPNVQAVKFIIKEILPLSRKQHHNWSFLAVGADPSKEAIELIKSDSSATLRANIADIKEGYCAGKVFVAPMKIGTGLQNKLLEAMALGIPSVTTTLANNALGAVNNVNIYLAESPKEFIEKIEKSLQPQFGIVLGKKGKNWIESRFNWKNATNIVIKAMLKA